MSFSTKLKKNLLTVRFWHYKSVLTYFTKAYKLAEQESGVNT